MTPLLLVGLTALVVFWVLRPILVAERPAPTGPTCPSCGPRPEADARFCSNCGRPISRAGTPSTAS